MDQPDFERARQYALERLQRELPPELRYHSVAHTRDEVVPAVERLAAIEKVEGEERQLLLTAAYYHDLGFVKQAAGHEAISARLAADILPGFGYTPAHVCLIGKLIMATRLPQSPHTRLEKIMADADLDILGREDFFTKNQDLRAEAAALGRVFTDEEWYGGQLSFMRAHRYFTAAARRLRDAGKRRNIDRMTALLEASRVRAARGTAGAAPGAPHEMEEAGMLSKPERVAILRSVSLFAETPDEILADMADLLKSLELKAGETIFHKGECGDCMYIIVEGRVRVHDGDLILNYLGVADVFGEMALLDAEPRVASVTAAEDTHLLRLDQDAFYELMSSRAEVARGVIRVLNRHLRGRVRDMVQDFEYMQQMARISAAAAALEAGRYDARSLDEVGQRSDELGQLARVFQRMANEVVTREQRLRQEVQQLRIQIDEAKKMREVAQITESEYFQSLQVRAKQIRGDRPGEG